MKSGRVHSLAAAALPWLLWKKEGRWKINETWQCLKGDSRWMRVNSFALRVSQLRSSPPWSSSLAPFPEPDEKEEDIPFFTGESIRHRKKEPFPDGTVNTDSTQWDSTYPFFPWKDSKRRKTKPSLFHKGNRLIFPSVLAWTSGLWSFLSSGWLNKVTR